MTIGGGPAAAAAAVVVVMFVVIVAGICCSGADAAIAAAARGRRAATFVVPPGSSGPGVVNIFGRGNCNVHHLVYIWVGWDLTDCNMYPKYQVSTNIDAERQPSHTNNILLLSCIAKNNIIASAGASYAHGNDVAGNKEGNDKSGKSNDNGNKECNGDGGKGNGNGNKEGKGDGRRGQWQRRQEQWQRR